MLKLYFNMEHINDFLNSVRDQKVLVIGDVMIDAYLWGNVNRISPEAPVPIVSITKRENRLGGAANVALNLNALGAIPIICSVIGSDEDASVFKSLMQKRNLPTSGIVLSEQRKTTKKTRVISDGQQLLRVDDEISKPIKSEIEIELIKKITKLLEEESIKAIVFEDYDKGVITQNLIHQVAKMAQTYNIPTTVDPKKRNYNHYQNVTLFKPNFKEFVEGSHLELSKNDYESIFDYAKKLIAEKNIEYVFVTLSELGVFICDKDTYHVIPAEIRQIADVSGAGDTVISVASLMLMQGFGMRSIAEISNKSGGLVCEKVGVVPITPEDLRKEVEFIEV